MRLYDRLDVLLKKSGSSIEDMAAWRATIATLPFDKQEMLVYLLEQLSEKDMAFFNTNLQEKIAMIRMLDIDAATAILKKERAYLSATDAHEKKDEE